MKEALSTVKVSGVDQVVDEHSPPYDSQANGSVENVVEHVKSRMRTFKLCFERRIGNRIPPRHPIMRWLARHAAATLRYRFRGDDCKIHMRRSGYDDLTVDWRFLVSDAVINSGPINLLMRSTNGIGPYFRDVPQHRSIYPALR